MDENRGISDQIQDGRGMENKAIDKKACNSFLLISLLLIHFFAAAQYWYLYKVDYTLQVFYIFTCVWCLYMVSVECILIFWEDKIKEKKPLRLFGKEIYLTKDLAIAVSIIAILNIGYHILSCYFVYADRNPLLLEALIRDGIFFLTSVAVWDVNAYRYPDRYSERLFRTLRLILIVGVVAVLQVFVVGIVLYTILPIGM